MLLYLTDWLAGFDSAFGVFQYLTLRAILGVLLEPLGQAPHLIPGPREASLVTVGEVDADEALANVLGAVDVGVVEPHDLA